MPRVGVRELKNQTSEIIREVRETRAEYVVTYHGRPVAVLLPVDEEWPKLETGQVARSASPGQAIWAELEALRQEIGQNWQSEQTAVELVSEQRR